MRATIRLLFSLIALVLATAPALGAEFPDEWTAAAQRAEIRPEFTYSASSGPYGGGAYVITLDNGVGQQGWFEKKFPVTGGKHYRFRVDRKTEGVENPRRSALVRIAWKDQAGKMVKSFPFERELEGRPVPSAEPEHPLDGPVDDSGWSHFDATYRAPLQATHAVVELHLQWASGGKAHWANPRFDESTPLPERRVRLASVHYKPTGRSPRQNCEEFAPLLEQAARQKADLVVLGETVPSAGVAGQPHELAEPIPGASTQYFCGLAKQHQLHLVFSLYERDGRVVYNTAVLIDPVSSTFMDAKSNWMLSAVYDRDGSPLIAAEKWGTVVVAEVDLNQRRVGPYNLGDFHDMVQRHRPPAAASKLAPKKAM